MIGKILSGRYEILEEIGKGGMAYVYKARCVLLNRIVAVKILRDDLEGGEEFLERFNAEAQAAASLDHPNIVSIFDVGIHDNRHYITMEYVDGQTLKEYIAQKGSLDYKEALNIAWQISDALTAAHAKNIVHRDIKPHNILITSAGVVKVADFGIARFGTAKTLSTSNDILGSVHYVSPEQAKGQPVDNRSDIYSLGVVLYEMLTGIVPFDSDNPVSVAMMQIENSPEEISAYAPDVPLSSQHVVYKAMSKDPDLRYQTAGEFKDDILNVLKNPNVIVDRRFLYDNLNPEPETSIISKTKEEVQAKTSTKITMIILAAITSFVIVFGGYLIIKVISDNPKSLFTQSADSVEIPVLVGENVEDAKDMCSDINIVLIVDDEIEDDSKLPGTIISQTPSAGTRVSSDKTVRVIVTKDLSYFQMKDYIGQNFEVVQKRLDKLGLEVSIKFEESDKDEGDIIKHSPERGKMVKQGDVITLFVSKPSDEKDGFIEVPNLVGKSYSSVKKLLDTSKLSVGDIIGNNNPSDDDVVIAQSIPAGSFVAENCAISLTFERKVQQTGNNENTQDNKPSENKPSENKPEDNQGDLQNQSGEEKPENKPEVSADE